MDNKKTVTCSFSMDRKTYDAYKSIVVKNHQNVKGNIVRYMKYVIEYETPNIETIEAIKEVKNMKKDSSIGKTYDSVDEMMKDVLYVQD